MKHYKALEIEPIEFIEKNKVPFSVGNVIKYVCRYKLKGGVEDLRKALRYVDYIEEYHITTSKYVEGEMIYFCKKNNIICKEQRILRKVCNLHRGLHPEAREQRLTMIRKLLNDLINEAEQE